MILGGFGFLSRLHGLSIDNLVEAEVVLADGSIVIVSEKEHPGTHLITSFAVIGGMC
jgi:FAD/FMN-containing dehydrogenase